MNIALVGFGYWGPNVARNINANPNLKLHTICDMIESNIEKAKSIYIETVNYDANYENILNNVNINAVAIATNTGTHYKLIKAALENNKHVYVEKPFTSTIEEALELEALAKEKNLIIHIDHIMIFHPAIKKIKEIISNGELGDILYIDATRTSLGQIRKDVSSMWDLAVHDLSIIDYLMDGVFPKQIKSFGEKIYNPKESITFLTLKYDNFFAQIESNWISPIKDRKLTIVGTKKMLVYDDVKLSEKLVVYNKNVEVLKGDDIYSDDYCVKTNELDAYIPKIEVEDALFNSIEHFRLSVVNKTESFSNPAQAIRIQEILTMADNNMNK
ncbi:Gfo/Idh/MocA family oxidoreductase [Aliarcobacter cibarius]|uniref:Gfo/Idh/MocA family oxidoreductase n=2 Tax=Aliarcobacter cibarius TaxID=255507 RepID=A0ABY2V4I6_9BACT|nr:Gfo/Idh/MocA family oxidoreductase [Aliarcobacter cibarius]TLT00028.1 Gfo/Idh/MocA family oxidoreductase [Aliarcobacter cibarius]TLT03498.1 Gfo/Idh/MocA family oxidoreductase [Aliarcobacter cibarius]